MVPDLTRRRVAAALLLLMLTAVGCRNPVQGADDEVGQTEAPDLGGADESAGVQSTGQALGGGEEAVAVSEAVPPGLRIVNLKISKTTAGILAATGFTGFRSGGRGALIELPLYGVDPRLGYYYLVVPVGNFGDAPVRNLKARADFLDERGVPIWRETQALTHFPTRLGLNPPSLPNTVDVQPPYDPDLRGYDLFYFPTNVGVFTFSVPDGAVSAKIRDWRLTFLVSTT